MPFKRLTRTLRSGLSGAKTAVLEIAHRTDRTVQLARLRFDQWELNRELSVAYGDFGQRVADLLLAGRSGIAPATSAPLQPAGIPSGMPTAMPTEIDDDPELHRLTSQIGRLQERVNGSLQQIAAFHLEEPDQAALGLRRRLRAAGYAEVVAAIGPQSLHKGRRLADIEKRGEWIVIVIMRRGAPFVPDGSTVLMAGDELCLFGPAVACERARLLLEQPEPPPAS
jgi:hypothetical protein